MQPLPGFILSFYGFVLNAYKWHLDAMLCIGAMAIYVILPPPLPPPTPQPLQLTPTPLLPPV